MDFDSQKLAVSHYIGHCHMVVYGRDGSSLMAETLYLHLVLLGQNLIFCSS